MSRFTSITNSEMRKMLNNLPSSLNIGSMNIINNKSPPGKRRIPGRTSKSPSPPGRIRTKIPSHPGIKYVSKKRRTKQKLHKSLPIKSIHSRGRSSSAPKNYVNPNVFKTPKMSLRGVNNKSIAGNSNFSNLINNKNYNSKQNKIAWQKMKSLTRDLRKGQLKGHFKNKRLL